MTQTAFQLAGGIGLFLLGMTLLTDGLKAFAGESLRRAMVRFTGTPLRAFASGALATALIQSSSATTVTVIGFVSAGILTFPQAIGVVFGASLGTTGTGWLVAVLGLEVSLGLYALPLVAVGAFIRLLARGRAKQLGLSLAGFALIFIGIDLLQEGMQGVQSQFDLAALPSGGAIGALIAMAIGIGMTLVMQSSSAAVATVLTALHADAIHFDQAAALTIGAAIGTTVTGVLAAIGGSVPAKRTALAHVLFNLATGLLALALLPAFLLGIALAQEHLGLGSGAISLAAFHTAFIALGVVLFLPFVHSFASGIEWVLPDRGPAFTRHLDKTLLHSPPVALEATHRALKETACALFDDFTRVIKSPRAEADYVARLQVQQALAETESFLAAIPVESEYPSLPPRRAAQMHAIDHLIRLHARLEAPEMPQRVLIQERLKPAATLGISILQSGAAGLGDDAAHGWLDAMHTAAAEVSALYHSERAAIIGQTANGGWMPSEALALLDWLRWLDRVCQHAYRACLHLDDDTAPAPHDPNDEADGVATVVG